MQPSSQTGILTFYFPPQTLVFQIASHFSTHPFNNPLLLNFYIHSSTLNDTLKDSHPWAGHTPILPGRCDKERPLSPHPKFFFFFQQGWVGLNNMHFLQIFKGCRCWSGEHALRTIALQDDQRPVSSKIYQDFELLTSFIALMLKLYNLHHLVHPCFSFIISFMHPPNLTETVTVFCTCSMSPDITLCLQRFSSSSFTCSNTQLKSQSHFKCHFLWETFPEQPNYQPTDTNRFLL